MRAVDAVSADLVQDGGNACISPAVGAFKTGSHFNYNQLRRATGARSALTLTLALKTNPNPKP